MNWQARHVFMFAVVFFFIYAVSFSFLPTFFYTARLLSVFTLALLVLTAIQRKGRLVIDIDIAFVICLYSAYCGWLALRTVMTGGEDISLLSNAVLLLVQVFPGAYLLATWLSRDRASFQDLVFLIHVVIVVQAGLIVLTFLSWDFRLFTLDLLHESESNVDALHPFRVRGFTHNTGAKLAAFQATGLLLSVYLLLGKPGYRRVFYLCCSAPAILGSILLTGRSGFVVLPLAIILAVVYGASGRLSRGLATGLLLSPLIVLGAYLLFERVYHSTGGWEITAGRDAFQAMIGWVTQEFSLYIDEGTLRTGTVGALINEHWFWPPSDNTFFFGDPRTWSLGRVGSDIGLIRMTFGAGLVGMVLLYGGVVASFLVAQRALSSAVDRWLLATVFAWMAIMELKEPYVIDVRQASLVALLVFFSVLSARRDRTALAESGRRTVLARTVVRSDVARQTS